MRYAISNTICMRLTAMHGNGCKTPSFNRTETMSCGWDWKYIWMQNQNVNAFSKYIHLKLRFLFSMKLPLSFALFAFCWWHEEFQVSLSCYQEKGNTLNIILSVDVCTGKVSANKISFALIYVYNLRPWKFFISTIKKSKQRSECCLSNNSLGLC